MLDGCGMCTLFSLRNICMNKNMFELLGGKATHEMATDPSIDPVPKKDDPQTRRLHKLKPQSIPTGFSYAFTGQQIFFFARSGSRDAARPRGDVFPEKGGEGCSMVRVVQRFAE